MGCSIIVSCLSFSIQCLKFSVRVIVLKQRLKNIAVYLSAVFLAQLFDICIHIVAVFRCGDTIIIGAVAIHGTRITVIA